MKTYLTPEDIGKMVARAGCERNKLLILLLWTTGMRVTELVSLRVENIDFGSGLLSIRHLKARGEAPYRLIKVRADVLDMLRNYVKGKGPEERVFPITRQHVNVIIRSVAKDAGLGGRCLVHPGSLKKHYVTAHRFRDALAVHWLRKNSGVEGQRGLQLFLGHRDFNTTARYFKLGLADVGKIYDSLWEK